MPLTVVGEQLTTLVIVGIVIALALVVTVVLLRGIKVAKPDEAIIVTSKQRATQERPQNNEFDNVGQKVVFGSRVFVKPVVEAYFKLSLRSRQLNVQATAQTKDAITIKVNAVAVVKVGGSETMVRAAAQRFLNQQDQIESSTEEVLSGSVRSIVGQLTVTEIITNRSALQEQVLEAVREALDIQGLQIDTLQIKEIDDDNNYIRDLGRAEAARVKQVAEVAEAIAQQASEEARINAAQAIAEQQRKLDLRNAEIQKETDKARAEASAAKPLADAIAQQEVVAQQEITAAKRVGLRKQELDAEVRAVADAQAYALEKQADGAAAAAVANAAADRDSRRAAAEAIESEGIAEKQPPHRGRAGHRGRGHRREEPPHRRLRGPRGRGRGRGQRHPLEGNGRGRLDPRAGRGPRRAGGCPAQAAHHRPAARDRARGLRAALGDLVDDGHLERRRRPGRRQRRRPARHLDEAHQGSRRHRHRRDHDGSGDRLGRGRRDRRGSRRHQRSCHAGGYRLPAQEVGAERALGQLNDRGPGR